MIEMWIEYSSEHDGFDAFWTPPVTFCESHKKHALSTGLSCIFPRHQIGCMSLVISRIQSTGSLDGLQWGVAQVTIKIKESDFPFQQARSSDSEYSSITGSSHTSY
ncbi:hypothetical protein K3495_g1593 [Podosphaera aphanis]|nr:hypothetical protein K3495_g1593 [Podosphaera aphanis]